MTEIQKEGWKFGREQISETKFMEMYSNWDNMDRADQQAARKLYGFPISHGDSMTGGAFHMVAERER